MCGLAKRTRTHQNDPVAARFTPDCQTLATAGGRGARTPWRRPLNPYDLGLDRNPANYVPLSPLSFLRRTAQIYPDRVAVIHGDRQWTWHDVYVRTRRVASALRRRGVGPGDTVAVMAPNIP